MKNMDNNNGFINNKANYAKLLVPFIGSILAAIIGMFTIRCDKEIITPPAPYCNVTIDNKPLLNIDLAPEFYHIYSDEIILDSYSLSEKGANDHFDSIRTATFKQLVEKAKKKFPFPIDEDLFESYQEEYYSNRKLVNTEKGMDNLLKFKEKIVHSEDSKKCTYTITLYSPKMKMDVLPMAQIILPYVESTTAFKHFNSNLSVNISLVVEELLANEKLERQLVRALQRDEGLLKVLKIHIPLNDEANYKLLIHKLLTFSSSKYELEYLHEIIIDQFAHKLRSNLLKNPNGKFVIQCKGYADTSQISGPIPYDGDSHCDERCREDHNHCTLETKTLDFADSSGKAIGKHIYCNNQLSYARAYEGIKYLQQKLTALKINKKNITFQYQGLGEDWNIATNNSAKRRIEFHLLNS